MKLLQKLCLLFFCACFLLLLPTGASACSCGRDDSPCQAAYDADAIFLGRVLQTRIEHRKIQLNPDDASSAMTVNALTARLSVEESFPGATGSEIEVSGAGNNCDYEFKVGQRYLVYARFNPQAQVWSTSICMRTRLESEAVEDLVGLLARRGEEGCGEHCLRRTQAPEVSHRLHGACHRPDAKSGSHL